MDDLPSRIDHTVLGPATTAADVERVVDEAQEYGTNLCIPPCYVGEVAERAPKTTLATVVGFPHGNNAPETKIEEAARAVGDGADELDVVINVGRLLAGENDAIRAELAEMTAAVPVPVKAIVEAPLLDEAELRRACELAADVDCAFVKTATGFADGGATISDVEVMAEYLPVKASGGIGSWERAQAMFGAGAERIGASSGDVIVQEWRAQRDD